MSLIKAIQLLEDGLDGRDWTLIEEAFEVLAGKKSKQARGQAGGKNLPPPEPVATLYNDLSEEDLDGNDIIDANEYANEYYSSNDETKIIIPSDDEVEEYGETKNSSSKDDEVVDVVDDEVIDLTKENSEDDSNRVRSRRVPFDTKRKKNIYIDKRTEAVKDIEFDKKVRTGLSVAKHNEIAKRPPPKKVKISCAKCSKTFILTDPALIPKKIPGTNERANYVCDRCVRNARGTD